jgi:peptide/nickel transport system ATP-binding protein
MENESIIKVENLNAYYGISKDSSKCVLDNVNLEVKKDQFIGIAGESGSGKTSLLKVLTHSFPNSMRVNGKIFMSFKGKEYDLLSLGESKMQNLRWKAWSYIPQGAMNSLNPMTKIKKIFKETVESHGKIEDSHEFERKIGDSFEKVGLSKKFLNFYSSRLSGGMRQRVIILLATVLKPEIIFLDEPTTGLDLITQKDVIQLLKDIHKELNSTFVLVTHDISVHAQSADFVHIMYRGQIVESAPTRDLFHNPLHPYTRSLMDSVPVIGENRGRIEQNIGTSSKKEMGNNGCKFVDRCPHAMLTCSKHVYKYKKGNHEVSCNLYESRQGVNKK